MKKLMLSWTLVLAVAALMFVSCKKDKNDNKPNNPNVGSVKDERDQIVYKTIKMGNQTWFAENLRYDGPLSQGNSSTSSTGGKLYDWQGANVACPNGWRLPSDLDFRILENYLGMSDVDTAKVGYSQQRGVDKGIGIKLQYGGGLGFNFIITTGINNEDVWTSTKNSSGSPNGDIYVRSFSRNDNSLYRAKNFEGSPICVRCLKN